MRPLSKLVPRTKTTSTVDSKDQNHFQAGTHTGIVLAGIQIGICSKLQRAFAAAARKYKKMEITEIAFTCDNGENPVSCTAWDLRTGSSLINYKGGGCIQKRSLNILSHQYVIGSNGSKPLVHVWPINHQEQISTVRFVLPGRADALALSPDNSFLVAGIQETIYIWHLLTGRMLNMLSKHYQPITCIRFTDNGAHFISASRDGGILVWNLTQVSCHSIDEEDKAPLYTLNDHGLPVTDVHIGSGGMRAYMYSCSLDRSCKIYDLSNGNLLLSVIFTEALHCVVANALETCVYVGSAEGNIFEFRIDSVPRTKEFHVEKEHTNKFSGHKAGTAVNCLSLSVDGHTLVSGGQDEQVCIWHIESRQLIRTVQLKGAVTNLLLNLMAIDAFDPGHKQPQIFGGSLRRMIDASEVEDEEEIWEVFITEDNKPVQEDPLYKTSMMHTNHGVSAATVVDNDPSSKENTSEELHALRTEIERLKRANKELYIAAANNIIGTKTKT